MSVLVGGVAGSSSRMSGGIITAPQCMVSDVTPITILGRGPSLGPRVGKFRRLIRDTTLDGTGAPLAGATVKIFGTGNDLKFDQVVSDGAGVFEASVYDDGAYFGVAYKAGAPDIAGTTVNTVRGV